MPLVGDPERDRAVSILRRAYATGHLGIDELEPRVDAAIRARSGRDLASSVRGIPGGMVELALDGYALPALRTGTVSLRARAARFLLRAVFIGWALVSAFLLAVLALVILVAGPSVEGAGALFAVWVIATLVALAARRGARKLTSL